ncbi:MAG: hypothetical protein M4579_001591 [Chaenotheca gracillima]|nr:MAG: hypothetical protein M4579_001591 [Chaenotheca gracillima]
MLTQRALQLSTRRLAASPHALTKALMLAPSGIATSQNRFSQIRPAATQQHTPDSAYNILVQQRLNRPVSPHLTIYRPQLTWILSGLNRITGSVLSGGLYVFATAYLAAPLFGWHLESASMAAAFGAWPVLGKVALKTTLALPFTFHCINGVRHLVWDTGKEFGNQQVVRTGWAVVGLTAVSTLGLATLV